MSLGYDYCIKTCMRKEIIEVISACALQIRLDAEAKAKFWKDMDTLIQGILGVHKYL